MKRLAVGILAASLLGAGACSFTDNSDLGGGDPGGDAGVSGGSGGVGGSGSGGSGASGGTGASSGAAGSSGSGGSGPKSNGDVCGAASECDSGFCVDGVCCNKACDGTCESCSAASKGTGSDGVCGPVAQATDPDDDCSDEGATSCGQNGLCDGGGGCALYPADTQCSDSSCSGGVRTLPSTCDGSGNCVGNGSENCDQGACSGPVCLGQCQSDTDCTSDKYCEPLSGDCTPKLTDGTSCQSSLPNACESGFCVDGVCCNTACTGSCYGCGSGTCSPQPAGQDPDNDCSIDAPGSCGQDGACDGNGGCRLYGGQVSCGNASCTGSTYTPAPSCDGEGGCKTPTSSGCGAYLCAGNVCGTSCTSSAQCSSGYYCDTGKKACVPLLGIGERCTDSGECKEGHCVDGVCCDSACTGSCQACSASKRGTGSDGTCGYVKAGLDPDGNCSDQGAASCGTDGACDGSGGCRLYSSSTECAAQSCSGSTLTPARTCTGSGQCGLTSSSTCPGHLLCNGSSCRTSCSSSTHCAAGYICKTSTGTCIKKQANGATCSSSGECTSGFCVDGYCCNTSCTATCYTCAGDTASAPGECGVIECGPQGLECGAGKRCTFGHCGSACL